MNAGISTKLSDKIRLLGRRVVFSLLSDSTAQSLKKHHYLKLLQNISPDDEPDLKIIDHIVKPGDSVVDIGANIGLYTKFLSHMIAVSDNSQDGSQKNEQPEIITEGKVFSIEPFPQTFELLSYNTEELGLSNVELMNLAVSSHNGAVTMVLPSSLIGRETHYRASVVNEDSDTGSDAEDTGPAEKFADVQAATMDSLFANKAQDISFVKCDVEGHEPAVIAGAKQFLKKTDCAWLIEVSGNPDDEASQAFKLFKTMYGYGYTVWWFDGRELHPRKPGDSSVNYFFLKHQHTVQIADNYPNTVIL